MTSTRRWQWGLGILLLALLGLWLGARWLLPSDAQLAAMLAQRFERASGVGLRIGGLSWALRPTPVVVLTDVATLQAEPITVRRVELRPRLAGLWRRQVGVDALEIDQLVLPRESVRAFRGAWRGDAGALAVGAAWSLAEVPLRQLRLRGLVWIDRRGIALAYDADIRFDARWRPREAEIVRTHAEAPVRLQLRREGDADRWATSIEAGGGSWRGPSELRTLPDGRVQWKSQLEMRDVDLTRLLQGFERRSAIEGRLHGSSRVESEADNVLGLLRRPQTLTRFRIAPARLRGFDLLKVLRSAGDTRGGYTALDEFSGTLHTQTTDAGVVMRYTDLRARSGVLRATGRVTVLNRRIDGEAAIDVVDGVVGMPVKLGGTLDAPVLSLTGGALAGAAVGSAVLPGAGTALGARLGQELERLFGGQAPAAPPAPGAPAR